MGRLPLSASQSHETIFSEFFCPPHPLPRIRKPSRHKKLNQCWFNVGPPSTTSDQRKLTLVQSFASAGKVPPP